MFFLVLFVIMFFLSIGGCIYLVRSTHQCPLLSKIIDKHPKLAWVLSFLPVFLLIAVGIWNVYTALVAAMYLIVIWIIVDALGWIVRKCTKGKYSAPFSGYFAIIVTAVLCVYGWYTAHHVVQTDYDLTTAKNLGQDSLRIVQMADSHLGVTLDSTSFPQECVRINALHPDLVVITGDFVDDTSCRADMEAAILALEEIQTTYGVFYSFGNHDRGYHASGRDFTAEEMCSFMEAHHITVLEDDIRSLNERLTLIGRKDTSDKERLSMDAFPPISDSYTIVLDHQPNDFDAEAAAHADLVLCGHTHGGHIFPAGPIGVLMGKNDAYYGHIRQQDTDYIITSGISGWAIPIKIGALSEFTVIDVTAA